MADRAPQWPLELVGSITPTGDFASAAVAHRTDLRAVGLDSEHLKSETTERQSAATIALPGELDELLASSPAGVTRAAGLTLLFSAKEAL